MTEEKIEKTENESGKLPLSCIIAFILIIAVVLAAFLYSQKERLITRQLEKLYGIPFTIERTDGGRKCYIYSSDEHLQVKVKSTWYGKIKSEDYVNYVYAKNIAEQFEEEIGGCFDDCLIIVDNSSLRGFPPKSINSYEEYIEAYKSIPREEKYFRSVEIRVYVRENEDLSHIIDAEEILKNSDKYHFGGVEYYAIPDDLFDAHRDNGIYTYYDFMEVHRIICNTLGNDKLWLGRVDDGRISISDLKNR